MAHHAFVLESELELPEECDPAAPGAAVTVELCGHWDHEGPCRWPHNSAIDADRDPALFRTVFVASAEDEPEVRRRIEAGLREGGPWRVVSVAARPVDECERGLAGRLLTGSRR